MFAFVSASASSTSETQAEDTCHRVDQQSNVLMLLLDKLSKLLLDMN
uniref:Uncharacterized protein n=1 Tax=Setaria italica TaxID=4555 RepID=K4A3J9_SETIT